MRPELTWNPADIWEDYHPTPLIELPALARQANVGRLFVKVESARPLGNFKALGGLFAGLRALLRAANVASIKELLSARVDRTALPRLICASDGNHGLAVAAAAQRAGTRAAIYLHKGVSPIRVARIEALGGEIVWVSGTYDDAVDSAEAAAARGEGLLIPDTSRDPDDPVVKDVMAGYALLTHELTAQFRDELRTAPTHSFVQAGVGGLAAAMADGMGPIMHEPKRLIVVEPESAACVARALATGKPVHIEGELHTSAEMLSCGLASAPALAMLLRHAARAVAVSEKQLQTAAQILRSAGGPATTPSGAAGLAGCLLVAASSGLRSEFQLSSDSHVLLTVTEGPADSAPAIR
jgi:diaminopropionate ammonia-lyase